MSLSLEMYKTFHIIVSISFKAPYYIDEVRFLRGALFLVKD